MHEKCHVGMECVTRPECARMAKTEHKGSDAQVSIVAAAGLVTNHKMSRHGRCQAIGPIR